MTRASYELIAADYDARNGGEPTPEFAAWRDNFITGLHARFRTGTAGAGLHAGSRAGTARTGGVAGTGVAGTGVAGTGVAAGPRVLDAGAGPGQHTAAFVAAGLRAVALDLSDAMARRARGRGVPVVLGDQRRLPFANGAFDGVWSSAALLHVPREDVPSTLREWRRVARPGAPLALATATGGTDGWEDPPYDTAGEHPPPRWFVYHDEPGLTALLAEAGWDVASVDRYAGYRTWLRVRAVARG